jgi:hypothetical protein
VMASFGGVSRLGGGPTRGPCAAIGRTGLSLNWNEGKAPGRPAKKINTKFEHEFIFYRSI